MLLSISSPAKGETISDSIKVLFEDGVEVTVKDWIFSYKFGESEKPLKGFTMFNYSYADSKDLLLDLGEKKSHGLKIKMKQKISPEEIKTINVNWEKMKMKNASILLKNGEIIKINGRPKPDCNSLSKKKHIFGTGDCPCIYLKGTGMLDGQTGEFEILLNSSKINADSDRFVEIRFAP
jgi:hypothetical protein